LAGTFDGDANTVKCYINGELVDSRDDANFVSLDANTLAQDPNGLAIGNRSDDDNGEFEGVIDDVRLYSRSLSQAEVVWLATDGTGFVPLRSKRNIFKQGPASIPQVINLRDLAILADEWRDRILWPLQP
jgi:hypothetical protein